MNLKGSLPTLILRVLADGPSHGYSIAQRIKATSRGVLDFKEGTLYPALHALELKGTIESFERIERGRTRRYYRLTDEGRGRLDTDRAEWKRVSEAISRVLREA